MAEEKNEQQQIEALAESVANRVVDQAAIGNTVKALLLAVRADVKEAAMEVVLRFRGALLGKRDREWAGLIASIWVAEGTEVPSNPHELRELIQRWVLTSEKSLAKAKQSEGYLAGFKRAYVEGARFGWGASAAGKNLEDVVALAEKKQP